MRYFLGVKGSPLEFYDGIPVSDHESAIIKHGAKHQECLAHIRRYMQGVIENEKEKTWGSEMLRWITKAIMYWNMVNSGEEEYDARKAEQFIAEYDAIMEKAKDGNLYDEITDRFNKNE